MQPPPRLIRSDRPRRKDENKSDELTRRSLLSGALAASLGLALLWATSRATGAVPFPPISAADRIIRLAPGAVATRAIDDLGHSAQPLLTAGVTIAMVGVLTLLPLVVGRGGSGTTQLGVAFFVVVAALSYADPQRARLVPVVAASAGAALLYTLAWQWMQSVSQVTGPDAGRRRALIELGSAFGGLVLGGTVLGSLIDARRQPTADVALARVREPAHIPARPPFPAVRGLSPEVTAPRNHYVVDIDIVDPVVSADAWRLRITGLVARPLELSFAELQRRFALVEEFAVLTCVSNPVGGPLIGNSTWTGVRLRDILATARVLPGALDVLFRGADGYTVAIPLERAREPSTLVAIAQGGRPLRQEHGFPCRVRVPSLYGMMNAKWVEEIVVLDHRQPGFWQQRGWSNNGVVRTESRIDTSGDLAAGTPGWIGGVAWAGTRGISRVEASIDGGATWHDAVLRAPLSPYAWTLWAYRLTPRPTGAYQVQCRAYDGTGRVQDRRPRPPHPSGASGYHEIEPSVA
jgi:DMSO/TMAO reductase YedYZ molybdopterin-dependent catalytic subunit